MVKVLTRDYCSLTFMNYLSLPGSISVSITLFMNVSWWTALQAMLLKINFTLIVYAHQVPAGFALWCTALRLVNSHPANSSDSPFGRGMSSARCKDAFCQTILGCWNEAETNHLYISCPFSFNLKTDSEMKNVSSSVCLQDWLVNRD